jgi:hypothetical protein
MSSGWIERLGRSVPLALAMGAGAALVTALMGGPAVAVGVSVAIGGFVGRLTLRRR